MWTVLKQKENQHDIVVDVDILAIGEKEHCISKVYDDYNEFKYFDTLTLEEIEKQLDEDSLREWNEPYTVYYKLREV